MHCARTRRVVAMRALRFHPWSRSAATLRGRVQYQDLVEGKLAGRTEGGKGSWTDVSVRDARTLVPQCSLEAVGFELRAVSSVATSSTMDDVSEAYCQELQRVVQQATGATRVIPFDYNIHSTAAQGVSTGGKTLGEADSGKSKLASVVRCDFTELSGPKRVQSVLDEGVLNKSRPLEPEDAEALRTMGDFMIVSVWRPLCDAVERSPLGAIATPSVTEDQFVNEGCVYTLKGSEQHQWLYYSEMTKDECMITKSYDSRPDRNRFCFNASVTTEGTEHLQPREFIEVRAFAFFEKKRKPLLFTLSPAAAVGAASVEMLVKMVPDLDVEVQQLSVRELAEPRFASVNPMKKIPALVTENHQPLHEASVIMDYLAKLAPNPLGSSPLFQPVDAELAAFEKLLRKRHDTYMVTPTLSSIHPNIGSSTLAALYYLPMSAKKKRSMSTEARAVKVEEIWKQLSWLEDNMRGPYLAGVAITLADISWFPTCTMVATLSEAIVGWPAWGGPRTREWYNLMLQHPAAQDAQTEVAGFWGGLVDSGYFDGLKAEILADDKHQWVYTFKE